MYRHTRAAAVVVAASALIALSACSGSGSGSGSKSGQSTGAAAVQKPAMVSVADTMAAAVKRTSSFNSSKVSMVMELPPAGTMTVDGRLSKRPLAMDFTLRSPLLAQELGTPDIHYLMTSTTEYADMGSKYAQADGGKPWLKVEFSQLGVQGAAMSKLLSNASASASADNKPQDPATTLKLLTASDAVKRVGAETVDGVQTTHYAGTLSSAKIAARQTDPDIKKALQQAIAQGVQSEHIDLWLNSDEVPVEVRQLITTKRGTAQITTHYSDFSDTPVVITPPPPSETIDLAALAALAGK